MNKYLSLIFLYNRASHKSILLTVVAIPLILLAIFFIRIGNPYEAGPYMLMESAFGGVWAVLLFIIVNVLGVIFVANSLKGRKSLKATNATTGYTMRRLCASPISAYITIFVYYLAIILIFWGVTIASLYLIGKMGLTMAGATGISTKLALGLLRIQIGHALIPIADPAVIIFDIVVVIALAVECARSCYLRWHNGTPSAGVVLVLVAMFFVWGCTPENSYILMAILVIFAYTAVSFGDVIAREKRPKGDPFKVNKYEGIVDLDSMEYDENVFVEVNSSAETSGEDSEISTLQRYGRALGNDENKGIKRIAPSRLRRRFMPLGINLEKANFFFGFCIFIGIAEHIFFYGKYLMQLNEIKIAIKGISIDESIVMPYFWDLQQHAYYGFIAAVLLTFFLQAYWNYEYYNKKTKSVFVMKRLPNRKEYSRTIWVSPIIQALSILIVMVLVTVIDICLYAFVTPEVALHPDYLSHILPFYD